MDADELGAVELTSDSWEVDLGDRASTQSTHGTTPARAFDAADLLEAPAGSDLARTVRSRARPSMC